MYIKGKYVTSRADFTEIEIDAFELAQQLPYAETVKLMDTLKMFKVGYEDKMFTHSISVTLKKLPTIITVEDFFTKLPELIEGLNELIEHLKSQRR